MPLFSVCVSLPFPYNLGIGTDHIDVRSNPQQRKGDTKPFVVQNERKKKKKQNRKVLQHDRPFVQFELE